MNINCHIILNDETFDENGQASGGDGNVYSWEPILKGNNLYINGNGFSVKGLYFNDSTRSYVGLFGLGTNNFLNEIKNLNIESIYINAYSYAFSLANSVRKVYNCTIRSGNIITSDAGASGVVGSSIHIKNCANYANIECSQQGAGICGGLIGSDSSIENCKNYGNVVATVGSRVAGIVRGASDIGDVIIRNCENYGNVTSASLYYSGGICAALNNSFAVLSILNCNNYGDIATGGGYTGGIIGFIDGHCLIDGCGSYGNVQATTGGLGYLAGGIVGYICNQYTSTDLQVTIKNTIYDSDSIRSFIGTTYEHFSDRKAVINIENCKISVNNNIPEVLLSGFKNNVVANIKNIKIDVNYALNRFSLFNNKQAGADVSIGNILVNVNKEINNLKKFVCSGTLNGDININGIITKVNAGTQKSFYIGNNFDGFFYRDKYGGICLKSMYGVGAFFTQINQSWLINNGYEQMII